MHVKGEGKYAREAADITRYVFKEGIRLSKEESDSILSIIAEHRERLLQKHKNIRMISSSPYISHANGSETQKIARKTCIVIFVDVKGHIPIFEELLPEQLSTSKDMFPVDVRECSIKICSRPTEFHPNVQMGCMIRGQFMLGTLGGFVNRSNSIYALTVAHTFLLDYAELSSHFINGFDYLNANSDMHVYQNQCIPDHVIGEITFASIDSRRGVDIAMIRLSQAARLPVSGEFPDELPQNRRSVPLRFARGRVYDMDPAGPNLLHEKFGMRTDRTIGRPYSDIAVFRANPIDINRGRLFQYELDNQIEVLPIDPCAMFAEQGDSGSLVFTDVNGEMQAIGMVVARIRYDQNLVSGIVTPIASIFNKLDIPAQFMNFP